MKDSAPEPSAEDLLPGAAGSRGPVHFLGRVRRGPRVWWIALVALLMALFLLTGCGYSTGGVYPAEVRTIALPLFENLTYERGLEADFGEALVKEVVTRTPYRLVGGAVAESTLSGTLRRAARRKVSLTRVGGVPEEVEYAIAIDFTWADASGRRVFAEAVGLEQVGSHVPAPGLAEPESVAIQNAIERLAEDVVDLMREDGWGERAAEPRQAAAPRQVRKLGSEEVRQRAMKAL